MYYSLISSMKKSSVDTDAQAFITAAAITDATQQNAINTLVVSLKSYGIWTKMKAVYPMVGGTATSHKFNLKDPRDLDVAFRLAFTGGWTHSSTGAAPNGSNAYADTFLVPINYNQDSFSFGCYLRTVGSYQCFMGALDSNTIRNHLLCISGTYYGQINSSAYTSTTITSTQTTKLHIISRTLSTTASTYINGTLLYNDNQTTTLRTNLSIWLGALNNSLTKYYSSNEHAFSFIADGLSSTEITYLTNTVNTYQTTLGRQV
jgi:hypothetical protein